MALSIISSCKSGSLTNYSTNFLEAFKPNQNNIVTENRLINSKVNLNYSPFVPKIIKNIILAVKNQPTILSGIENINALISGEKEAELLQNHN
ncbi:MAG: hypothetical protein CM15mP86_00090 [Gammaproteobacteria bacterium]|nr:MAG: hypothetical protein CM15mP86_00090 [Gammaproteobacteria bacterium]